MASVRQPTARRQASRRILLVVTEELAGSDLRDVLEEAVPGIGSARLRVIAPAVERTPFRHALGDVDVAIIEAGRRLERSLAELRRAGLGAEGEVGDSDPLIAAADNLREFEADEVLIVVRTDDQARWFENGLLEGAGDLGPPVRMLPVREESGRLVVHPEKARAPVRGEPGGADREIDISPNLPRFHRGDLFGILFAVVGTIVAILLAATGPSADSAGGAAQILIAMAVALINMAHVVGLVLLESVDYRGGWERFFRNLSSIATPAAIVANGLITLLS